MIRRLVTLTWIAAGFTLAVIAYFLLGARIGVPTSPAYSNPRVPYAPVIFITGVVFVFLAAVIYELLPDREEDEEGDEEGDDEEQGRA